MLLPSMQDFDGAVMDVAWSPNSDELACAADTGLCVDIRNVQRGGARVAVLQVRPSNQLLGLELVRTRNACQ